jgi:prepilin-type N-terminal cleavage/methylation domain-containing protein
MVKRSPDNGFTLIEVLVAMTILSVAIAGAVAALIQGNRMVEEARNLTRVSQIVQSEIEALRTMNWVDLEAMPNNFVKLPLQGSFASKFQDRYTLYRLVVDHGATQKGVYLYVYWRSPEGFLRRQWHYARFTQGGLNDYFYRAF